MRPRVRWRDRLKAHSHWVALLALLAAGGTAGYTATRPAPVQPVALASPSLPPINSPIPDDVPLAAVGSCASNAAFAAHTYHPQRLAILKDCVTITGLVEVVRHEADGDLHVLVKLDPQFAGMTNSVNDAKQKGDLVVEPQCVLAVSQADAAGPCQGSPPVPGLQLLVVGARVRVTGPYVTDSQHLWNEIHPVEAVEPG